MLLQYSNHELFEEYKHKRINAKFIGLMLNILFIEISHSLSI